MKTPPLSLLQTLHAFVQYRTVNAAAQALGLTQPTVSRQLQRLEELVPCPLFSIQGNRKVLTRYGQQLIHELEKGFHDLDLSYMRTTQIHASPEKLKITFASRKEILDRYASDITFQGFLELIPSTKDQLEVAIKNQTIDMGIGHKLPSTSAYLAKKLFTSKVKLVIPNDWCKNIESAKEWTALDHTYPFCSYSNDLPYIKEFTQKYKTKETPLVNVVVSDWHLIEKRVHLGLNWSLIPSEYILERRNYKIFDLTLGVGEQAFHFFYRKEFSKLPWFSTFEKKYLRRKNNEPE